MLRRARRTASMILLRLPETPAPSQFAPSWRGPCAFSAAPFALGATLFFSFSRGHFRHPRPRRRRNGGACRAAIVVFVVFGRQLLGQTVQHSHALHFRGPRLADFAFIAQPRLTVRCNIRVDGRLAVVTFGTGVHSDEAAGFADAHAGPALSRASALPAGPASSAGATAGS